MKHQIGLGFPIDVFRQRVHEAGRGGPVDQDECLGERFGREGATHGPAVLRANGQVSEILEEVAVWEGAAVPDRDPDRGGGRAFRRLLIAQEDGDAPAIPEEADVN